MSAGNRDTDETQINEQLLEELDAEAQVLGVRDEVDDVALDLHEAPFSESARRRALAVLGSPRYEKAARRFHDLQSPTAAGSR